MDNSTSKKLSRMMNEITAIYIESKGKLSIEKKWQNYNKGCILIGEADELIQKLQNDIANLNINIKETDTLIENLDQFVDLLKSDKISFDQVMYIAEQLEIANKVIPNNANIIDGVEHEVFYEDEEVVPDEFA